MFIDFVTYLEIRDDLSKEDEQYKNSEIERYMAKYEMKKDGIRYYMETKCPGSGFHAGCSFYLEMSGEKYKEYIKYCDYNSYFEGSINVNDSVLDYYNKERIKWIPVNEGYPDSPRQVLCTYKYEYDSGPEYEVEIGEYWGNMLLAGDPEGGFGRRHKNVIAWAELPKPFNPKEM